MSKFANDNLYSFNHPLLQGEDPKKYVELHDRIALTLKSNDVFEEFWIDDLTDQVWESARYRSMAVALLQATMQRALQRVLAPMVDTVEGEELILQSMRQLQSEKFARGYFGREAMAMEQVDELLKRAGLNFQAVQAEAMAMRGAEFQRINQLLAKAEVRRAATLRAIDRHRTGLGAQLQSIAQDFEQAAGDDAGAEAAATQQAA